MRLIANLKLKPIPQFLISFQFYFCHFLFLRTIIISGGLYSFVIAKRLIEAQRLDYMMALKRIRDGSTDKEMDSIQKK